MLEIGRQLKLLAILFLFALAFVHLRLDVLSNNVRIGAHVFQHLNKEAVVVCKRREDIRCLNHLATLRSRAFHRAFEKLSRVGRNTNALAYMLLTTAVQSLINCDFDNDRIQRELAHG